MRLYLRLMMTIPLLRLFLLSDEEEVSSSEGRKYYEELAEIVQLHARVVTTLNEKGWPIGSERTFFTYSFKFETRRGWFRPRTTTIPVLELCWIHAIEGQDLLLTRSGSLFEVDDRDDRRIYRMITLEGTGVVWTKDIVHFLQSILDELSLLD